MTQRQRITISKFNVVSRSSKELFDDHDDYEPDYEPDNAYTTVDKFAEEFKTIVVFKDKVHFIDLSQNGMDDEAFGELTETLLPMIESMGIITDIVDLSFNMISDKSLKSLVEWKQRLNLKYINLNGNPLLSHTKIAKLCNKLEENNYNVIEFMTGVVFITITHISHFEDILRCDAEVYKQMVEKGYLPVDWVENTRNFYKIKEYPEKARFNKIRYEAEPTL